jgi:L-lactate dehydrogenase complex protein LldG
MSARDEILSGLRQILAQPELRFPPPSTPPLTDADRMAVTEAAGGPLDLAHRFGEELVALHGSYEVVESPAEARLTLLNRLMEWMDADRAAQKGAVIETGQERSILAWDPAQLPVDGLGPALEDMELQLVTPDSLQGDEEREAIRFIRYGVTGVDAAFASTGTMLTVSGEGKSRAASLLPYYHVGLIPLSRLYPTVERWLAEQREAGDLARLLRDHANVTLITGPSKSADIEMNLTLGVHGPKFVHAILFWDESPKIEEQKIEEQQIEEQTS